MRKRGQGAIYSCRSGKRTPSGVERTTWLGRGPTGSISRNFGELKTGRAGSRSRFAPHSRSKFAPHSRSKFEVVGGGQRASSSRPPQRGASSQHEACIRQDKTRRRARQQKKKRPQRATNRSKSRQVSRSAAVALAYLAQSEQVISKQTNLLSTEPKNTESCR
jgi:hypothetical protein